MATINLRDYYPFYQQDMVIEVSDEVAGQLSAWERSEAAFMRKRARYRAFYSLDCDDGIEHLALFIPITPEEHYEQKISYEQLYAALSKLPCNQARRIYAHFILGISQAEIGRREGVSRKAVNLSIFYGLQRLEKYLRK